MLPGAHSREELGSVLLRGKTTYSVFPAERIDPKKYLDPKAAAGMAKIYSGLGGYLPEEERQLGGRRVEAAHGWILDTTHRALESARMARGSLRGKAVPIFLAHSRGGGRGLYDAALMSVARDLLPYLVHCSHPDEFTPDELKRITETVRTELSASLEARGAGDGSGRAVNRIAGLIAESLGTTEKALIVDGNCTGGLIALELASRELAKGAPFALAGALSYVDTVNQVIYSNCRLLSVEGCFPFLDSCSGTVISDGAVMLVLTTLERARKEGLPVFGILRGVGGANDGAVERYMLTPNARGHVLAIERAHDRAKARPSEVGVFFAHGSGTTAGDSVEGKVFNGYLKSRWDAEQPRQVPVLSVKGNVGHAKEASGLANLVALLSLFDAEAICPPVAAEGPRESLKHHEYITVGDTARPWPADGKLRMGGVSAIASGGQNYHAVIEAPPSPARAEALLRSERRVPEWRAEPIAIVGLAASFAGAPDVATLWSNLVRGRQAFRRGAFGHAAATAARAGLRRFGPSSDGHAEIYSEWGAPLDVDLSSLLQSADRYGERPSDILRYDPLHFVLVELAWLAASGRELARGDNVGVVVSADHCSEYGLRQVAAARLPEIEHPLLRAMRATGKEPKEVARTVRATMKLLAEDLPELWQGSLFNISPSFLAARIARAFDLTGPTCAIEAGAAGSSFAALDVACGRLAAREVDEVFWATADMRLGPLRYADECSMGYLSRRSSPTALDASADGYLPGEGATVCLLRRLSDAQRRGEKIYGVIRSIGSAFAPLAGTPHLLSATAMTSAIRRAYQQCEVSPDELAFLECFGSGLPASDHAEVCALKETLAARTKPLRIGAVMPNVGHTGAAAGAASLFKALLALSTGTLPATVGVKNPIVRGTDNLRVVSEAQTLDGARYAGINAAGTGGTHYHVVLEAGPDRIEVAA